MDTQDYRKRFDSVRRLYGDRDMELISRMHICVVGLGGVGSWAVEALARTGVGELTIIDFDEVALSNINRQLPALSETVGQKKFRVLCDRVEQINPHCLCHGVDDFLTERNIAEYLSRDKNYDYVIDAIDSISFKASMIHHCKRNKIPVLTTGGAGGLTDPTRIAIKDLSRTWNDALAAKVRSRLRAAHGFTRNPSRYFGVECVFSTEQQRYPREDGTVGHAKPGIHGISLDCSFGYGSATFVTGSFGFVAASRVIHKALARRIRNLAKQEET